MLELYKRIKCRREELNMTQDALAKKVGYKSRTSIHKIETGLTDLSQSKIMEIADALATTPEYLMGWTSEVSKHVSKDEAELLDGSRTLPEESKQLVRGMIFQLNKISPAEVNKCGIVQNNVNNSGANILNVGNSHFKQNVSIK